MLWLRALWRHGDETLPPTLYHHRNLLPSLPGLDLQGTYAVVIAPTRELAAQIFDVLSKLAQVLTGDRVSAFLHCFYGLDWGVVWKDR